MERYFLSPIADPGMIPVLASYGEDAIPLLERLLHHTYDESCRAALLITELGDTVHYDEMETYGKNNLCLAWNLARLQPERARPLMLAHLLSKNPMNRRQAVHSLGSIGDSSYLPLLRELISDTDAVVSSNAAFALGFLEDTSGAEILRKATADTEGIAGQNAERLLTQLPEALIEPVLHSLLSLDQGVATQRAVKAAGQLRDSASVPYLLELLMIENSSMQLAALDALGQIGMTDAREPVKAFLDSEDMKLKVGAILAAGALKDTAVVGRLNLMLFWEVGPRGEAGWIRYPIVDALAMIGDTSALPALALALDDGDSYLGVKVLSFFREHGSSDYIPFVEPLLESSPAPLRIEAAAAILAMAKRELDNVGQC
jgi:HEAT repeat protein